MSHPNRDVPASGPPQQKIRQVTVLYRALLGRQPDPKALEVHVREDLQTVAHKILNSQEFRQSGKHQPALSGNGNDIGPVDVERVVYLHIPKCGGTTLHALLAAWYGAGTVHPERLNRLNRYSAAAMTPYRVFSGHYDYYSTCLIPGQRRLVSFLRDPRDRLISLYHFHRAHRPEFVEQQNLVLARWAVRLDIDAYFANETVRAHLAVNNSIARHFSDVPQFGHLWNGAPDPRQDDISLMRDQALKNLARFDFVGFMSDYDASVARLAELLGKPPVAQIEAKQTLEGLMQDNPNMRRIEKQTPSAETLSQMEELVIHDRTVYDAARERFAPGAADPGAGSA
ncbi:sulfotransferase family 2 domain-containing protein [Salipiger abyssi]|uniref:sulfotransferase family 2 domain-containing protein n=1 Tax=Salipiger abyssi TaxID=1250539 RepID=UPI001A909F90|nr:sulfotransferase family 2 domain-containing protein [Salipiger abyssi]MBN9889819.1 sulfotransferase family 2 domain-containing protein [Salipiger abyssi]